MNTYWAACSIHNRQSGSEGPLEECPAHPSSYSPETRALHVCKCIQYFPYKICILSNASQSSLKTENRNSKGWAAEWMEAYLTAAIGAWLLRGCCALRRHRCYREVGWDDHYGSRPEHQVPPAAPSLHPPPHCTAP